jgi:hypothetical protein
MSRFKAVLLAVAIAIVLVFFVGFGIASFYKIPQYEDFCGEREFKEVITQEKCEVGNGKWTNHEREIPKLAAAIDSNQLLCTRMSDIGKNVTLNCETLEQIQQFGYCDMDFYCRESFNESREKYNRNVFIVATGIGILVLILGFALKMASVSAGLMSGGVLTIFYGIIRYWTDLPDYGRFIILGITLFILIWLGYKKIKK